MRNATENQHENPMRGLQATGAAARRYLSMSHAASRSPGRRGAFGAVPRAHMVPRTDPDQPRPRRAGPEAVVFEADADGARVRICARDEVVIACGQASITLRRNGRVVIR